MKQPTAERDVIDIRNLSRQFGDTVALHDVNCRVRPGQVFGIVGENGAGKTTLIKHILGLYQAQQGSVRVFGLDPVAVPEQVLARIGFLSEEPDIPPWMKVSELMKYTAAFYPRWDSTYAAELLALFKIDVQQHVRYLSKGMRARVGLCLAQAHRPELLLLDEPSSGLDPVVRRDILSAIIRTVVEEGRSVIFSSHFLDEIERVCDHLMMLRSGRVLFSDPINDVLAQHHELTFRSGSLPALAFDHVDLLSNKTADGEWQIAFRGDVDRIKNQVLQHGADVVAERVLPLSEIFQLYSQRPANSGGR